MQAIILYLFFKACLIMLRNSLSLAVDGYLRLISLLIHIHLAFQIMSWQSGYVEDRCIQI